MVSGLNMLKHIKPNFPLNLHTIATNLDHFGVFPMFLTPNTSNLSPCWKVAAAQKSHTDEDLGALGAVSDKTPNRRRFKSVVARPDIWRWPWMALVNFVPEHWGSIKVRGNCWAPQEWPWCHLVLIRRSPEVRKVQARSGGRPAFPDIKGGHSNDLGTNFYALGTLGLLLRFFEISHIWVGPKIPTRPGQVDSRKGFVADSCQGWSWPQIEYGLDDPTRAPKNLKDFFWRVSSASRITDMQRLGPKIDPSSHMFSWGLRWLDPLRQPHAPRRVRVGEPQGRVAHLTSTLGCKGAVCWGLS